MHSEITLLAGIVECAIDILLCWRKFLLESPPMVCLQMCALADPDLVHFPLWAWLTLIIGIGLIVASLSVHMELRAKIRWLEAAVDGLPSHHSQHALANTSFRHPYNTWSEET